MIPTTRSTPSLSALIPLLREARGRTDEVFSRVRPEALHDRPISMRHRFIFYLGHVEAFDWNLIGREALGLPAFDEERDRLFAFGIDPVDGRVPDDRPSDWPPPETVRVYGTRVRGELDAALERFARTGAPAGALKDGALLRVAIEHRLMHAETLAYMLNRLPPDRKIPPAAGSSGLRRPLTPPAAGSARTARLPAGTVTLGLERGGAPGIGANGEFGWDNEFGAQRVEVGEFTMDVHNVTNAQFMEFVKAGGYQERSLWSEDAWVWREREDVRHPAFWRSAREGWRWIGAFEDVPLPASWPVFVSHAEASAYARWLGRSLPTEAEWHRAACGTPGGRERAYPWGESEPAHRGNFDFDRWDPVEVGSFPAGASAFGVEDLIGNGWEWTATPFEPFPGFEPFPFYPGYSADFFDGRHFVLKGGSMRTAARLLRRSFRNWFQPFHPHVHAAFRCVDR